MNSEINLDEISDDLQILINNVSIETRLWFYERSQMAQSIDFIDERLQEKTNEYQSIWTLLTLLVYRTLDISHPPIIREAWLSIGELRQVIRQSMAHNPMVGVGGEGSIFKDQFTELINHILESITPKSSLIS